MRRGAIAFWVTALALSLACPSVTMASVSPLRWSPPRLIDYQPPFDTTVPITGISCPAITLCVAVDSAGDVLTSRNPTGDRRAWRITSINAAASNYASAISCPTTTFCAIASGTGEVITSANPAGGRRAWKRTRVFAKPTGVSISCASPKLCVIGAGDEFAVSTRPTAGSNAWHIQPGGLQSVSCPSTSLCVAYDGASSMLSTSDPTGPASAWRSTKVDAANIGGIACPSASLCVAGGGNAYEAVPASITSSTDPAADKWKTVSIGFAMYAMACPSVTLCVGVGEGITTSHNPAGGTRAWSAPMSPTDRGVIQAVSCPSVSLCVAADDLGEILASRHPGGDGAWSLVEVDGRDPLGAVACPTASLCVAGDYDSKLLSTARPGGGPSAWRRAKSSSAEIHSISCPSRHFCLAGDGDGGLLQTKTPRDLHSWQAFKPPGTLAGADPGDAIVAISCHSRHLCVAADTLGNVLSSANPGVGPRAWHYFGIASVPVTGASPGNSIYGVSCQAPDLCVIADGGNVVVSTHPLGGVPAWRSVNVEPGLAVLSGIACPERHLCVAIDDVGAILTSTHPLGGAPAWQRTVVDPYPVGAPFPAVGPAFALRAISCPTRSFCVAVDQLGYAVWSTQPLGGAQAWHRTRIDTMPLDAISCATARQCVAVDEMGYAVVGAR